MKTTLARSRPEAGRDALKALSDAYRRTLQIGQDVQATRGALGESAPLIVTNALLRIERVRQRMIEEIEAAETYIEECGLA